MSVVWYNGSGLTRYGLASWGGGRQVQCEVGSVWSTVCEVQCAVCEVCGLQFAVCSVKCIVEQQLFGMHCAMCSEVARFLGLFHFRLSSGGGEPTLLVSQYLGWNMFNLNKETCRTTKYEFKT